MTPSLQVSTLHPRPSREARAGLLQLGCNLDDAKTEAGRQRLLTYWINWNLSRAIHQEMLKDPKISGAAMVQNLYESNPEASFK